MAGSNVTLKQFEALIWVADLGGFGKAAEHLNTTQPNISARIAGLETALGVSLMDRDRGAIKLTNIGRDVLAAARTVMRDTEAVLEIAGRRDIVHDKLRLGVTDLVAYTWLRQYLRQLKSLYPNVTVELTVDLSINLDKELASNALDLTIQNAPFASGVTGVVPIGFEPYVWCAAPALCHALPKTCTLSDIAPSAILTHARHTQAHFEISEQFKAAKLRPRIVPSNSLLSCLHMAIDGMGIAAIPRSMADHHGGTGVLTLLNVDWVPSPLEFCARYHRDRAAGFVAKAAELTSDAASIVKVQSKD